MSQVCRHQLTQRTLIVGECDPLVEDARRAVRPRDVLQFDPPPSRGRLRRDLLQQRGRSSAERDNLAWFNPALFRVTLRSLSGHAPKTPPARSRSAPRRTPTGGKSGNSRASPANAGALPPSATPQGS